jgi:hypothetical protein
MGWIAKETSTVVQTPDNNGVGDGWNITNSNLTATLSAMEPIAIGTIGHNQIQLIPQKSSEVVLDGKNIDYMVSVPPYGINSIRWLKRNPQGSVRLEGNGVVFTPTCIKIVENKVYIWDCNNLWHIYSIEKWYAHGADNGDTIDFIEEGVVKHLPLTHGIGHYIVTNEELIVFDYINPPTIKDFLEKKTGIKVWIRVHILQWNLTWAGDIPLTDSPDNYDWSTLKLFNGSLFIKNKSGNTEQYMIKGWANYQFDQISFDKISQ